MCENISLSYGQYKRVCTEHVFFLESSLSTTFYASFVNNFKMQAIQGFRETERKFFNPTNSVIVDRIKKKSFPKDGKESKTLPYTHILDLADFGFIKPHIDSSRVN